MSKTEDERHAQLEAMVSLFSQAARLLDVPRLQVWDQQGITLPQLRILFRIRQHPEVGVKELAQTFAVSASNITQQVDKLVTRGLVHRVERPEDRRQVRLTLTPDGAQVASEISQTARSYLRALLSQLDSDDLDTLGRVLQRLLTLAAETGTATPTSTGD
jgi:MarR family transcriptional regulator, organic hydroperoxide resistance regulator